MTETTTSKLVDGLFIERPNEKAPSFVKAKASIQVDKFILFLEKHKNAKGYVNLDLLTSKAGKLYFKLNDFKPKEEQF